MANFVQWVILIGRAARSFAIGAFIVAVPLALGKDGYSTLKLNVVLSAGLAGATLQMQYVTFWSRRLGRRHSLAIYTLMMAGAGGVLATTRNFYFMVVAVFLGSLSLQPNISVHAPLEQATLADHATDARVFANYNGISTIAIALGNFAIATTSSLGPHLQIVFTSLMLLLAALPYLLQPHAVDTIVKEPLLKVDELPEDLHLPECNHFRRIVGLAVLFGVDSFAGGMTLNSFLIHWMVMQYDVSESVVGTLFGVCSVATTPSLWVAAWLGERIGLVNTMVFTHLPANFGLVVLPFMTNLNGVYVVFLFRALLSQMDVPARDAFMMTVVDKSERVACSSFINTVRGMACILGPLCSAFLSSVYGTSLPLILAGFLKCAYDITLFITCRSLQSAG